VIPVKSASFGFLEIAFNSRVLEPREWTKLQSEWAAELSPELPPGPILELCAGAGHIGLLAAALTGRELIQVEADSIAAKFAAQNAAAAPGLSVEVRNATIAGAVGPTELFPLILADPPYIPTSDVGAFPDDPRLAIDGGEDGLDVVRQCLRLAVEHLADDGALLLQVRGSAQAREVARLIAQRWPILNMREIRGPDPQRAVVHVARRPATNEAAQNGYCSRKLKKRAR
jgi:release factor glutamine methyltransferase